MVVEEVAQAVEEVEVAPSVEVVVPLEAQVEVQVSGAVLPTAGLKLPGLQQLQLYLQGEISNRMQLMPNLQ